LIPLVGLDPAGTGPAPARAAQAQGGDRRRGYDSDPQPHDAVGAGSRRRSPARRARTGAGWGLSIVVEAGRSPAAPVRRLRVPYDKRDDCRAFMKIGWRYLLARLLLTG